MMFRSVPRESSEAPAPVPASVPLDSGKPLADPSQIRPGQAVALLGLTDSGKTSFLYALKHAPADPDRLRWSWPSAAPHFAGATGADGARLVGTLPGTMFVRELGTLRRAWVRRLRGTVGMLLSPARSVVLPEISGEDVRLFTSGEEAVNERQSRVTGLIEALLARSDELLFLVGVKESHSRKLPTQDDIERVLSNAASALERCAAFMRDPAVRAKGHPVFLTFLITKRDALRDMGGLGVVRVKPGESLLGSLVLARGGEIKSLLRPDELGCIEFDLNEVCDHREADVAVQEAAAWDFLRCHAPKAAAKLSVVGRQHGVSLRVLTGKPLGCECLMPDGTGSALPLPSQIECSMVWEALDDVVERSFRWRARKRLQRGSIVFAGLALLATVFPIADSLARQSVREDIAARRPEAALRTLDSWSWALNPWRRVANAFSLRHEFEEATLWAGVADALRAIAANDREIERVDREVMRRDPTGALAQRASVERVRGRLGSFLVRNLPADELQSLSSDLRASDGLRMPLPDVSGAVLAAEEHLDLRATETKEWKQEEWKGLAERARQMNGWVGGADAARGEKLVVLDPGGGGIAGIRARLEAIASIADARASYVPMHSIKCTDDDAWHKDVREVLAKAVVAGDAPTVALAEGAWHDAMDRWFAEAADPEAIMHKFRIADGWSWDLPRARARVLAQCAIRAWAEGLASQVGRSGSDIGGDFESLADGIDQVEPLEAWGPKEPAAALAGLRQMVELDGAVQALDKVETADLTRLVKAFADIGDPGDVRLEFDGLDDVIVRRKPAADALRQDACARARALGTALALKIADTRDSSLGKAFLDSMKDRHVDCAKCDLAEPLVKLAQVVATTTFDGKAFAREFVACADAGIDASDVINKLDSSTVGGQQAIDALNALRASPRNAGAMPGRRAFVRAMASAAIASGGFDDRLEDLVGLLRLEGLDPMPDVSRRASALLKVATDLYGRAERTEADKALSSAVRVVQALKEEASVRDAAAMSACALVENVVRGVESGPVAKSEEWILAEFGKLLGTAGSELLSAMNELKEHRKRAVDLGLREVREGPVVVCLMGEHEFRLDDLRRVTPFDKLFTIPNFPFKRVGLGGLEPSEEANQLCVEPGNAARLGLSRAQAMEVAQLRGCRLPTSAEWDAARRNLTYEAWSTVRASIKANQAWGDGSPEVLKGYGDRSSDEIVGLGFGVREWVSDADSPKGNSNRGLEENAPAGELTDVGFRLALDAVPAGIRRLAEPGLAALPAPAQGMARQAARKISEETDLAKLKEGLAQLEAQAGQVRPQMEPVSDFLRKKMNDRIAELEKGAR